MNRSSHAAASSLSAASPDKPIMARLAAACACATLLGTVLSGHAQMPNMALMDKWSKANLIHYEVTGEISVKGLQIPPTDADLYADVSDRVRISFDWDKKKRVIVGSPVITNEAAKVSNLAGVDKGEPGKKRCPTGNINGAFDYFELTGIRQDKPGPALELIGKRNHPETQVAEACGNKLRTYKGAVKEVKEFIAVPDPMILAYGGAQGVKTIQVTPDGKSIVMSALNNKWVWTFTPTAR